jgi:hypothetical protein
MARWPLEVSVWLTAFLTALIPAVAAVLWLSLRATPAPLASGGDQVAVALIVVVLPALLAVVAVRTALRPLHWLVRVPPGDASATLSRRGILATLAARLAGTAAGAGGAAAGGLVAPVVASAAPAEATTTLSALPGAMPEVAREVTPGDGMPDDVQAAVLRLTKRISQATESTQRQATAVNQTIQQMEVMAVSASGVSERTAEASAVAGEAVAAVHTGQDALTNALAAMALIRETTLRAARQVKVLGESGQFVRQAVGQVQYNADELHLIAGNASIEAARHPDAASFFRNVADAIEQLAQQSQVALGEIQHAIEANRQETGRVAGVIEDVVAEVSRGSTALGAAGGALDTITEVVGRLAALNAVIAQASQEQARVAATVAESIDLLAGRASETLQGAAEQAALAAQVDALIARTVGGAPNGAGRWDRPGREGAGQ